MFMETSAKTAANVNELFVQIGKRRVPSSNTHGPYQIATDRTHWLLCVWGGVGRSERKTKTTLTTHKLPHCPGPKAWHSGCGGGWAAAAWSCRVLCFT